MANNNLYHWGIKGMKWGVRRYQNKDGTLTDAGERRYARDARERTTEKQTKGGKVTDKNVWEGPADPHRWVREDRERSKKVVDAGSRMANDLKQINDRAIKNKPKITMDLSNMTDKEMREQINRALLERQYNDMFAPKNVSAGRERASKILETAGSVFAVTGSALSIALAVKELTG